MRQQLTLTTLDQMGIKISLHECRVPDQTTQQFQIRRGTGDPHRIERPRKPGQCIGAVGAVNDQLRNHRIVIRGDLIPRAHTGVDPHTIGPIQTE